ncbi:kinesin-like protein KIF22 isoform X2 [Stylophora pistillata]|uniref:kinesin-like protein KIF22 isoform X2 n=1 Tax=Stylophora pistillata TaxID=50429 RepID=UPI000C0433FA|nr:kinesin-like protein KIF22 isoform X2 [Stylophora pistillata]
MANMAGLKKACKVQVLVRLRPEHLDYKEKSDGNGIPQRCVRAVDSSTLEIWNCRNSKESIRYRFNRFFDEDSTQETIFHNSVRSLIPFVLQGQNASVFAYGPTGAGKTHTMVGSPEEPGLIPRCAAELFKLIDTHHQDPTLLWKYKVLFSYLEIYQEKIIDLLDLKKDDLPIRQDQQQNILIPNLTKREIETLGEFMSLFVKASHQRKTAATKLNPQSSRSHSIVLIQVKKHNQVAQVTKLIGKFYLIDLAGSEDNRKTGNEGIRLKESGAINSSLFALGQVVDALNQGLCRVPYRNSKLTRLLQDSLGGSAHSFMIANIAPEMRFYADTVNTLNFASKSRTIVNEPFVRRTVDKSLGCKRYRDVAPLPRQAKRRKKDDSLETHELSKPTRKPIIESQKITIPAGIVSPLRAEQGKIQDRLAALEKLTSGETLTWMTVQPGTDATKENEILQVLNDGTIKDLKRLQGVGHKRAQLLLNWRTIHGPFQQVQDLKLIDGFTDKMVTSFLKNNLLSRITFS